jgi:succinyl-diaminopimelate desuccinylase
VLKKLAVVTAFMLVFGSVAWGASAKSIEAAVDANREDQISATRDFAKFESYARTTDEYDGPYPVTGMEEALNFVMDKAKEMGFDTATHEWEGVENARAPLYGYVEFGLADAAEMIMVLTNLEKGQAMTTLYALQAVKDSGVALDRRIRLFFGTTDGHAGMLCASAYADRAAAGIEEWPVYGFTPDSGSFRPVRIEKASLGVIASKEIDPDAAKIKLSRLQGGTSDNAVSDNCKALLEGSPADLAEARAELVKAIAEKGWDLTALPVIISDGADGRLTIEATGRAADSGQAWRGVGANNRMMYLLSKVSSGGDWQAAAEKIAALLPPDEDSALGAALGINEGAAENNDNVTVNMGWAHLEENEAGKPALCIEADIRYAGKGADELFPGVSHQSGQEIKDKVEAKFAEAGIQYSLTGGGEPYTVPSDSEVMARLQKAYGVPAQPRIICSGTYASAWAGIKLGPDTEEVFGHRVIAWGIDGDAVEAAKIVARGMVNLASEPKEEEAPVVAAPAPPAPVSPASSCVNAGIAALILVGACVFFATVTKRFKS